MGALGVAHCLDAPKHPGLGKGIPYDCHKRTEIFFQIQMAPIIYKPGEGWFHKNYLLIAVR
jgi:hypothetical protein